ncbi:MAG: hypothetical protein J0H56_08925 [Micrococcales bacterium]|nr:hypothetical protein [Micrococcales bacterium]
MARVLALDYEPLFGDSDDMRSSFGSDTSCFDFDIVLWDPAASFASYADYAEDYQGLPALSDAQSAKIKADVARRRVEFAEFVKSGRTLIVVVAPPQECYVATGEVRTSGTGRNAAKTRVVEKFDLYTSLPVDAPGFVRRAGNRIAPIGNGPIQSVLRTHAKHLHYAATMAQPPGEVLAQVQGTKQAVSSALRTPDGGLLLLIPETTFEADWDGRKDVWPKGAIKFQSDLLSALVALDGSSEISRPAWAERFATQQVLDSRKEVAKQQAAVERVRARLAKAQEDAELAQLLDQLYLGTGRQVELRVADVLRMLGGVVTEPAPGRDDWKVSFDGRPAVLEVKGVKGSAAEKHAAQLEKWVAGEFESTGNEPKGVLVVNTWRETPLGERTQVDFPDQMLPYSIARNHCLVTGLELFCIAQDILRDPTRKEHWKDKLLTTSGPLIDVPDWREFLQETSVEVDSQE